MSPKPKPARSSTSKPKAAASSKSAPKSVSKSMAKTTARAKPAAAAAKPALRPICFMVMPYGKRKTEVRAPGVPAEVDFDTLYDRALLPAIEAKGYMAVRADQESSPLILLDMLERLTLSDLVLADITLQNGNVYYEVGVRHATEKHHCVLIAADWARPLFDLAQIRHGRYPLPKGQLGPAQYKAIRRAVEAAIDKFADSDSPVHRATRSAARKPNDTTFAELMSQLAKLQSELRSLVLIPDESARRQTLQTLLRSHVGSQALVGAVAFEFLHAVRDHLGWQSTIDYIAGLPPKLRDVPYVKEQLHLAQSKAGDHRTAIAGLEALIADHGDTPERRGLLGGRFKKLYDQSSKSGSPDPRLLDKAIEHYECGMQLDLNPYYPANNLPRLYRLRNRPTDGALAEAAERHVLLACERALARQSDDEWLRPTLLGAAFDAGDLAKARDLAARVRSEGPATWKLATTVDDLERSAGLHSDPALRAALLEIVAELRRVL